MKTLKIISDLLPIPSYSVIILCFFMPFMVIKCGTTELASVSGFDLAKGTSIEQSIENSEFSKEMMSKTKAATDMDEVANDKPSKSNDSKPSVLLIIPMLVALIGLIISFLKINNKSIYQMVLSGVGFLALLIFGLTITNSDELKQLNSASKQTELFSNEIISVKLGNAYFVSTFLFVLILSFYAFEKYWKKFSAENTTQTLEKEIDTINSEEYVR